MSQSSDKFNEAPARVSVITRTRDRLPLLRRALESVLGQSNSHWEHIIVNDGGDAAALEAFLKPYEAHYAGRLVVVRNAESVGMQDAANAGLAKATGDYVAIHDDDDSWAADFLSEAVAFLEQEGPQSAYQGVIANTVKVVEEIGPDGEPVELSREAYLPTRKVTLFSVGCDNPFPPIAFVYRRKVHETIGLFDRRFGFVGDMDFNIRFLARWNIGVINRPLAFYHWRKSGSGALANSVTAGVDSHERLFNELMNHYLRSDAQGKAENLGLALNAGRYLVRNDRRMAALIERISWLQGIVENLNGGLSSLPEQSERVRDLKEHLNSISSVLNSLLAADGELSERSADIKEHLDSHTGALSGISDALNGNITGRLGALKEHLDSFTGILDGIVRSQELASSRGEALQDVSKSALEVSNAALERSDAIANRLGELSDTVGDIKKQSDQGLALIGSKLDAVSLSGVATEGRVAQIEEQLAALRSDIAESERGFRIGPLRILWRRNASKQ
ncbi:MAG: glycosyltransferase [Opitutales bacterium]|nr:glycosyltransferase [Opitutales bacterium]